MSKIAIALVLVLILCVSLLSGCNSEEKSLQSPQNTPSTSGSDESTVADITSPNVSNMIIPLPKGWTKVDSTYVIAQYTKNTASFIVKEEIFKSDALDDIVKEDEDNLERAFDNVKFAEPEEMKVAGKDAIKVAFTTGEGDTSMKFETIIINAGVSTYVVTCGDLESSFDSAGFDEILRTIEFK